MPEASSTGPSPSPGRAERDLLRIEELTKAYPGVLANDHVTLSLKAGQIHALVGENGAGKTTLMGMVYGVHRPDAGRIVLDGRDLELLSPRDALAAGIAFVQQTFSLIPTLTVAENLVLASHGAGAPVSLKKSRQTAEDLGGRYDFKIKPSALVDDLTVGERQQAELMKALAFSPRVLLLDEPTSVLTPQQAQHLSVVMKQLAADGIGIFLITHKLEAVLADADHVSVLRRGRLVGSMPSAEASFERLAELMIGELPRRERPTSTRHATAGKEVLLHAECISAQGLRGTALNDITISVRAGEILGVAGVEGSGQVELTEALAGVRRVDDGVIRVGSRQLTSGNVRDFKAAGVAHIPADRRGDAVIETLSVADNLVLPIVDDDRFSRFGVIRPGPVRRHAAELIDTYDIRVPGPEVLVGALSGGNQQKVVVARECWSAPIVTIACYPTQGLDFSALQFVWDQLRARRGAGGAVVLASMDLDELLELSDRIVVLHGGQIAGEITAEAATSEQLGLMMGGLEAA